VAVRTQWVRFAAPAFVVLAGAGGAGCFSPSFEPCAVTCGTGGLCPGDQVCLRDNKCHASEAEDVCGPGDDGDAGVDAGLPVTPSARGDLVVTEIQKNPAAVEDMQGEWFEVLNPTRTTAFDLRGLRVHDEDQMAPDVFEIERSLIVPPGGRIVFGRLAGSAENGGVEVDFAYGNLMDLGNDDDEIVIENPAAGGGIVIIDEVRYMQGFPGVVGKTLSLDPDFEAASSNDDGSAWCNGQDVYNGTDFGSPGEPNPQC
jgi:hypothetical protein